MTQTGAPPAIEPAELSWQNDVPESRQFGDIYFSRDNGLAESRYVFIRHNDLHSRFAAVPRAGSFVVAENGFGTGLNFLATWHAWQTMAPSHAATLHFVSAERFPLTREDLEKALSFWPELRQLSGELLASYPPLVRGTHRLILDGGRVRLTLFFGDVHDAWQELDFYADAWFLDGFAPALNPQMWQGTTINLIRRHSQPGTTVATFTAAGQVRRMLKDAGFRIHKADGFGRKRDMLCGVFEPEKPPWPMKGNVEKPAMSVAVIGAGIAGCLLANNLARRGYSVTLIDSADHAGSAASGNLQGAMYVKLGVEFNQQTALALSALTFSQRYYGPYRNDCWHPTGLLQLAWNEKEQDRQRRFIMRNQYPEEVLRAVTRQEAETHAGVNLETGGLWFPGSGWLEPGKLCESLAAHPDINKVCGFSVAQVAASDGQWRLCGTGHADIQADRVVICAGHNTPQLVPCSDTLRFGAVRGQVTYMPEPLIDSPRVVICGTRYLNPAHGADGKRVAAIGATFDVHNHEPDPTMESHRENIRELAAMTPQIVSPESATNSLPAELAGRVGFRCTTHDYQPVAGPLYNAEGQPLAGMYLLTGLGSKGLTYAPLLAEFLADQLTGQPSALPASLAKRVATGRMYLHQKK